MKWNLVAIGLAAGLIVGYMRVSKGGGRTSNTPSGF